VDLKTSSDGIWLSAPHNLAGLIELRGRGIVRRPYRETVRLSLIVDLVPTLERMPETTDFLTMLQNHEIPRCPVPQLGVVGIEHQRLLIEEALDAIVIPEGA
jgi:serine kinase of HPr protein (carbohydrate metabolism regulator)